MYPYNSFEKKDLSFINKILLFLFVLIYPVLVSIYITLPPFIGLVGYLIMINMSRNKLLALSGFFYLLNLELNLTLPILLSIFVVVMVHIFFYSKLKRLIRCRYCLLFVLIISIDFFYYMSLFMYDFMFNTSTIIGDVLLVYYILVDIFLGLFL